MTEQTKAEAGAKLAKAMRGRIVAADFEANTITLEMVGDYYAAAGEFVIVPAAAAESHARALIGASEVQS